MNEKIESAFLNILWLFAVITVVLFINLNLFEADLSKPFYYQSDAVQYHQIIKSIVDTGWIQENPLLGFPEGQYYYDFPVTDYSNWVIIKFISLFSNNWAVIINIYYILTFYLIGLISFYVMKKIGLTYCSALIGSVFFSFLPYHFFRNEAHLGLGAYFVIPLVIMIAYNIIMGINPVSIFRDSDNNVKAILNLLLLIFTCVLISTSFPYYLFFSLIIIGLAGIIRCLKTRNRSDFIFPMIILILIIFIFGLINVPHFAYYAENGKTLASYRPPQDTEIYGLKIIQMLLPMADHRFPLFDALGEKYATSAPFVNENRGSSLGLFGSLGFIFLLFWILINPFLNDVFVSRFKDFQETLNIFSSLNIGLILFATVGGLGTLFSYFATPQFRCLNRLSIFIAFMSIVTFFILLEILKNQYFSSKRKGFFYLLCLFILLIGIYDLTSESNSPPYFYSTLEYNADEKFINEIEANLEPGDVIFQLPYVKFPTGPYPNNMTYFDDLKPYLHSKSLIWSAGGLVNRYGDQYRKMVSSREQSDMLDILVLSNVSGLFIDTNGYSNKTETELFIKNYSDLLNEKPLVSDNGRYVFFNLKKYHVNFTLNKPDFTHLNPFIVIGKQGFYPEEGYVDRTGNFITWRWSEEKSNLLIMNPTKKTFNVTMTGNIYIASEIPSNITIEDSITHMIIPVGNQGSDFSIEGSLQPGSNSLIFTSDAPSLVKYGENRNLNFWIKNLEIRCNEEKNIAASYVFSTPIYFGINGTSPQYQTTGWSHPEEGFTWTNNYLAELALQMEKTNTDVTLTIDAFPYLGEGALKQQNVSIQFNEHEVGELIFSTSEFQEKSVIIPKSKISKDGLLYISFKLPNAISPKDLGRSEDERKLAIAIKSLKLENN